MTPIATTADPALSVQLYALRREMAVDSAATLRGVPALGFDGVELAGDYGWDAPRWRDLLAETGLEVVAAHVGLEELETDFAALTVFHRAVGHRRLVVSSLPESLQTGADAYRAAARRLNALGLRAADEGFRLAYHNHAFEFAPLADGGGAVGMDFLLRDTDPGTVRFEVDTFWVERGGRDAVAFLRESSPAPSSWPRWTSPRSLPWPAPTAGRWWWNTSPRTHPPPSAGGRPTCAPSSARFCLPARLPALEGLGWQDGT